MSNFYHDELQRALHEQRFGIVGSRLISHTSRDARASVSLLEGVNIEVMLTSRGFQVSRNLPLVSRLILEYIR